MELTNEYQAAYIARKLLTGQNGIDTIAGVLSGAGLDMNPHQIHAALFALTNPYLKGAILADEVGLGKTIEAGIVIAQKRAEGKKNIIVLCPATLRDQWAAELAEKFELPTLVIDSGNFAKQLDATDERPIVIISYEYAQKNEDTLREITWELAVFDEAHKLRNVFKDRVISSSIHKTFKDTFKLLLTATPLQNSLLELYGLASFIDENLFGDIDTFKDNFMLRDNAEELGKRLATICVRTLRRQVLEYIKFTDRYSITQEFEPSAQEARDHAQILEDMRTRKVNHLVGLGQLKRFLYQTKIDALTTALKIGFDKLNKSGASQKAVVFTEYRNTQDAIEKQLSGAGYSVVTINGDTKDRATVIQDFKDRAQILVSTEVGGEGLNLQFCSLVVNFDLPWNPQKIEQRIGRCHRYGQQHDVAVINFLAKGNHAEARLHELLTEKLKLFNGVFGASDTVLGVLEDVDFEKRIENIMTQMRTPREIDDAFAELQKELEASIKERTQNTKAKVFQYLDRDVAKRFKDIEAEVAVMLSRQDKLLWAMTKHYLGRKGNGAAFTESPPIIIFEKHPGWWRSRYGTNLVHRLGKGTYDAGISNYNYGSQLGLDIVRWTGYLSSQIATAKYTADSTGLKAGTRGRLFMFEVYGSNSWWQKDAVLIGRTTSGDFLDEEMCGKIIMTDATELTSDKFEYQSNDRHEADVFYRSYEPTYKERIRANSAHHLDEQIRNFEAVTRDKIQLLEKKLAPLETKIERAKAAAKAEKRDFKKKLALHDEVAKLENELGTKRMEAFEAQRKIMAERDELINDARAKIGEHLKASVQIIIDFEIV